MLSRTADNLYWLARYMERAENLARILEVADRMALTPDAGGHRYNEWHSAIVISGCEERFYARFDEATRDRVVDYLALDLDNPSSIAACLKTARGNGRAVRAALTGPMWETLNGTWLDMQAGKPELIREGNLRGFLDWVKERSLLFHGATSATMVRNDAYFFTCLGTSIERADNTARLLDVKYHVLLPEHETVGGSLDFYQWSAVLRSVSALGSYYYLYRDTVKPWLVAELLILRPEMPRSLVSCLAEINRHLDALAEAYGKRHECHRLGGALHARLRYGKVDAIVQAGLHEFLTEFIEQNATLGGEIGKAYLLA